VGLRPRPDGPRVGSHGKSSYIRQMVTTTRRQERRHGATYSGTSSVGDAGQVDSVRRLDPTVPNQPPHALAASPPLADAVAAQKTLRQLRKSAAGHRDTLNALRTDVKEEGKQATR
jgi:hypothetical protein